MSDRKWRGHGIVWWIVIVVIVAWLGLGLVGCFAAIATYG